MVLRSQSGAHPTDLFTAFKRCIPSVVTTAWLGMVAVCLPRFAGGAPPAHHAPVHVPGHVAIGPGQRPTFYPPHFCPIPIGGGANIGMAQDVTAKANIALKGGTPHPVGLTQAIRIASGFGSARPKNLQGLVTVSGVSVKIGSVNVGPPQVHVGVGPVNVTPNMASMAGKLQSKLDQQQLRLPKGMSGMQGIQKKISLPMQPHDPVVPGPRLIATAAAPPKSLDMDAWKKELSQAMGPVGEVRVSVDKQGLVTEAKAFEPDCSFYESGGYYNGCQKEEMSEKVVLRCHTHDGQKQSYACRELAAPCPKDTYGWVLLTDYRPVDDEKLKKLMQQFVTAAEIKDKPLALSQSLPPAVEDHMLCSDLDRRPCNAFAKEAGLGAPPDEDESIICREDDKKYHVSVCAKSDKEGPNQGKLFWKQMGKSRAYETP